jgi:hypothetical protein
MVPVDPSVRHLGEDGKDVPEDQCKWAAFISHHQADGSHQVLWLGGKIESSLKEQGKRLTTVWIDKEQRATVDGMHEGVRLSRHFILFLTKEVLSRKFCREEISNALKYRKNVILVYQTDERHGGVPGPFFDFYGKELKKWFPNAEDCAWLMKNSYVQFHDRAEHVDVMLHSKRCENGILDQMQLEQAPVATPPVPVQPASPPRQHREDSSEGRPVHAWAGLVAVVGLGALIHAKTRTVRRRTPPAARRPPPAARRRCAHIRTRPSHQYPSMLSPRRSTTSRFLAHPAI